MKPYPTYRPSGVPWLGDLPAHWHVKKAKYIAPIVGEKADGAGAGTRYVGLEHVEAGTGQFVNFVDGMQTDAESTVNFFAEGDVLFRPKAHRGLVIDLKALWSAL